MTILIVEDNPEVATVFADIVEAAGRTPEIVSTGQEALAALASKNYALALVDMQIPGVNGADMARQARELGIAPPMIGISGYEWPAGSMEAAGFSYLLTKPVKMSELLELIGRFALPQSAPD